MRREGGGISSEADTTRGSKIAVRLCCSGVIIHHSKEVIRVYCNTVGEIR